MSQQSINKIKDLGNHPKILHNIFNDLNDPNKERIAYEWLEKGYDIPIAYEMGSIEKEVSTFEKELKDAEKEVKEMEYNLYKTFPIESLQYFKDGKKIKMLFQIENDRVLAESLLQEEEKEEAKELSVSQMNKLLKETKWGNYLVTKNNKQKKKRKKKKRN